MKDNNSFSYSAIDSFPQLKAIAGELEKEKTIAVDLEADSMYHFREKVCLIQMATRKKSIIIDPLRIDDLSPLKPLFLRDDIKKIFHGADYDVRCLYRDFDVKINNLFDTQIASMFLGVNETSLDAVLQHRFKVRLNKKYQKKDWSVRPLPEEMLSYAAMDVKYLLPLCDQLKTALAQLNRLSWVEEECEMLSKVRPASVNNEPLFLKFKGAGRLDPRTLAILESLLVFRKRMAEKKDKPLYKIFRNASLMRIAMHMPPNKERLAAMGELSQKQIGMYGDGLIRAVTRASKMADDNLPAYPRERSRPMKVGVPERVRTLKSWRQSRANRLNMDPALICNNALAGFIATRNPRDIAGLQTIPGIRKWQIREFGKEIITVLRPMPNRTR